MLSLMVQVSGNAGLLRNACSWLFTASVWRVVSRLINVLCGEAMRRILSKLVGGRRKLVRQHGRTSRRMVVERLSERSMLAIDFVIDYRFDEDRGWFDPPERRQALEAAANALGSYLNDTLAEIDPYDYSRSTGQSVTWSASIKVPTAEWWQETANSSCGTRVLGVCTSEATPRTGRLVAAPDRLLLQDFIVPANTITVFVGVGRQQAGELATTYSASVTTVPTSGAWADLVRGRGQAGALASPASDVSPSLVSISFDPSANWSFDMSSATSSQPRLYSAALRQLGQALGIGNSPAWERYVNRNSSPPTFSGPDTVAAHGSTVPLNAAATAWVDSIDPTTGDNLFSATLKSGLHAPTAIDLAALDDLGWQLNKNPQGWGSLFSGRAIDSTGMGISGALIVATCSALPAGCPTPAFPEPLTVTNADGYYSYRFHPAELSAPYVTTNWGSATWQVAYTINGDLIDTLPVVFTNRQVTQVNVQKGSPAALAEGAYLKAPNDALFSGTAANEPLTVLQIGSETHVARGLMDPFVILPSPSKVEFHGGEGLDSFGLTLGQTVENSYLAGSRFRFEGGNQPTGSTGTVTGDLLKVTGAYLPGDPPVPRLYNNLTIYVLNRTSFVIPALNIVGNGVEQVELAVKLNSLNIVFADNQAYSVIFDTISGQPDQVLLKLDGRSAIQLMVPQQNFSITSRNGTLDLLIQDFPSTFNLHNETNRHDVNRDGMVTPLDALNIINYLNTINSLTGGNTSPNPWLNRATAFVRGFSIDVVKDDFIVPGDVLAVINRLNNPSAAEGEGQVDGNGSLSQSASMSSATTILAGPDRPVELQATPWSNASPKRLLPVSQIKALARDPDRLMPSITRATSGLQVKTEEQLRAHEQGLLEWMRESDEQAAALPSSNSWFDARS